MNVYVASSWRNELQPSIVEALRKDGHEVYDFRHPTPGDDGFAWRQVTERPREQWDADYYANHVLEHPVAARGFTLDMDALDLASACVLVLPCGRSAHLELGYAVGRRKLTVVYVPKLDEPELMYRMCDCVETSVDGVRRALSKERHPPRWQADMVGHEGSHRYPACREYHHRECSVCGQCWRHGACICSPSLAEFRGST